MKLLWEDLKMLFEIILAIVIIHFIFWSIVGGIFGQILVDIYTNDNNTNEQIVDYDTYIQNTYNPNFNKNTQTVEEKKDDTESITFEDLQEYKQKNDYKPGKTNPFGN